MDVCKREWRAQENALTAVRRAARRIARIPPDKLTGDRQQAARRLELAEESLESARFAVLRKDCETAAWRVRRAYGLVRAAFRAARVPLHGHTLNQLLRQLHMR